MVYCGKPSKGCQGCRVRKTKCDLARPSCGQCLRTQRRCSGYRNPLDLSFRDESLSVVKKAKAQSKQLGAFSIGTESLRDLGENGLMERLEDLNEKPLLPSVSLSTPFGDMAIEFFISHHIVLPTENLHGEFEYTLNLLASDENKSPTSPLTSAVRAVGLATYSNIVNSPELLRSATIEYVRALRLTNISLSSTTEATKDPVLLSIILLSVFESTTATGSKNLVSWNHHIRGSIQLLNLRGKRQLETEHGLHMWHHLTAMIISSCIQRECHIPESLRKLRQHVSGCINTRSFERSFHWQLIEMLMRFVNLVADFRTQNLYGLEFIDTATSLDEALVTHFSEQSLPDFMKFYNVSVDASRELLYGKFYSIYQDSVSSRMWNHLRVIRMHLLRMIRNETRKLLDGGHRIDNETKQRLHENLPKISVVAKQLSKEICASVPQQAGYLSSLPTPQSPPHKPPTITSFSEGLLMSPDSIEVPEDQDLVSLSKVPSSVANKPKLGIHPFSQIPNTSNVIHLLWPLYYAGQMEGDMKFWAINRLEYLGRSQGLGQALMLAGILRESGRIIMFSCEVCEHDICMRYPECIANDIELGRVEDNQH